MIPPAGFKAEMYPLRHRFNYSVGLSLATETVNSTMLPLVRNYKGVSAPNTIVVNPHHASFETETGSVCSPMSIIDKLKLTLKFNMTRQLFQTDFVRTVRLSWFPIFFSFPEKLDATDDKSSETVATILSLTKDATQEDVTPAYATKLPVDGNSDLTYPMSTANISETKTEVNLTTDETMEGVPFDKNRFHQALEYYTNKGALKACIGRTRNFTLTADSNPNKTFFIDKFVPKPAAIAADCHIMNGIMIGKGKGIKNPMGRTATKVHTHI